MSKAKTLGGLLASLFPKSNRALSEKLNTEEYNELADDVQVLNSRLMPNVVTAAVNELTVTAEQAAAVVLPPTEKEAEVAQTEVQAVGVAETEEQADASLKESTEVEDTSVQMASLPAAELDQLRADAAAWKVNKGEYGVLKNWYEQSITTVGTQASVDATDVAAGTGKSWEKAPWNTK